jgi:hypothetical protein
MVKLKDNLIVFYPVYNDLLIYFNKRIGWSHKYFIRISYYKLLHNWLCDKLM